MEEHFVWMTTRRIKPGTLAEFERAWRPGPHPEGMLTAYAFTTGRRSSACRSGRHGSHATRGGPRMPRRDGARPWRPTSSTSARCSTGGASFSCRLAS